MINGEKVCVHDGTWKDCEVSSPPKTFCGAQADPVRTQNGHEIKDFIRQIEAEYRKLNGL